MHLYILLLLIAVFREATCLKQQVISFPNEAKGSIVQAIKKCAGSEEKTAEYMEIVQSGKYREDDEFKVFIHCCYKTAGYSYEDGRLKIEESAPLYPDPTIALSVFKECDKKRGKTPVETSFAFFKCFQKISPFLIGTS